MNAAAFDNTEKVQVRELGADAALKWRGLSVQGEYLAGRGEGRSTGGTVRALGWYGQAGYFVLPKRLEVAGRYSRLDPSRSVHGDRRTEIQGAVSYYMAGHDLKVQADVTESRLEERLPGKNATRDRQLRLQAQVAF